MHYSSIEMEYIEVKAQEAFVITNIINEMFHCMDQGKLIKTISRKFLINQIDTLS